MQTDPLLIDRIQTPLCFSLLACSVFLFAGCATPLDRSMNRTVGKHISEVFQEHGKRPASGRTKINDNRYAYTYRYYRTRYAGTENLGTYNNPGMGTGRTTYFAHVCYARYFHQTYYTNANDIVVDWHWELGKEYRIDCNER